MPAAFHIESPMGGGSLIVALCPDHVADWNNPVRMPTDIDPMRLRFWSGRSGEWPQGGDNNS